MISRPHVIVSGPITGRLWRMSAFREIGAELYVALIPCLLMITPLVLLAGLIILTEGTF